jgi:NitT/TauT family transport system substrate-binding protein
MKRTMTRLSAALLSCSLLFTMAPRDAMAEASQIRVSHGYGLLYLPLMIMREQHLIEKHAKAAGLGDVTVQWSLLDGGNVINDAMLAGSLDIAGIGAPGFITLWSKARGIPRSEIIGLGALSTSALWLNSNNPQVKSLKDLGPKDKIAVPGIKTSLSAVILQMAAAKTFGFDAYDKLDSQTVSLAHPEALTSLESGKTEITAHLTSPPFSYEELQDPKIHRVFDSAELLGNITLDVIFAPRHFVDENPRLTKAFMDAQEEANAMIVANHKAASEAFLRVSKMKLSGPEVERMLDDKNTQFSTTPSGMMQYVLFMGKAGTIKSKPAAWFDMFVPALRGKNGS